MINKNIRNILVVLLILIIFIFLIYLNNKESNKLENKINNITPIPTKQIQQNSNLIDDSDFESSISKLIQKDEQKIINESAILRNKLPLDDQTLNISFDYSKWLFVVKVKDNYSNKNEVLLDWLNKNRLGDIPIDNFVIQ